MVEVLSLLYMAAMPVLDVFVMASVGYIITVKGIMDKRLRQGLGLVLFYVFIPCLTFSKLGNSLNWRDLAVWWILPVNMAYAIGAGLLAGYVMARLLRCDPWFRKIFMCVMSLGNVGNLPIVLVQSVCSNDYPIFTQALPGAQCEEKGIAYVAFSMWVASTFQFCVALRLMRKGEDESQLGPAKSLRDDNGSPTLKDGPLEIAIEMSNFEQDVPKSELVKGSHHSQVAKVNVIEEGEIETSQARGDAKGNVDTDNRHNETSFGEVGSSREEEIDESQRLIDHNGSSQNAVRSEGSVQLQQEKDWKQRQKERLRWIQQLPWGQYMNMPTLAAAAGLSVGCISILKDFLFGDTAPLSFLTQSITIMSGAMIPCMMLILGSGLSEGPGETKLPLRIILGAVFTRLILLPAIGLGSVLLAERLGIFHAPNSMFKLVLLVNHCPPTALNLQTCAIINRNGEAEVATLICWQYIASLLTIPFWMAVFLSLLS